MPKTNQTQSGNDQQSETRKRQVYLVAAVAVTVTLYSVLVIVAIWHPALQGQRLKFGTENGLTLAIVVAVIAQVLIYWEQWSVMNRGLNRQETAMRQWVDLQPFGISTSVESEAESEAEQPEEVEIDLRWKIVNNTSLPFTVRRIEIHFCRDSDVGWEMYDVVERALVQPAPHSHNFYPLFLPVKLTKGQTKEFLTDGLGFSIAIQVTWIDALGREQHQRFGDFYECGMDYVRINEPLGKGPTFIGIEKGEATVVETNKTQIASFTVEDTRKPN
jgi:uncharacterized membrane protein (DUF485 family)